MEVWGGAVPDSVMRYLNENPWTRLETIHKAIGNVSKLTALFHGLCNKVAARGRGRVAPVEEGVDIHAL